MELVPGCGGGTVQQSLVRVEARGAVQVTARICGVERKEGGREGRGGAVALQVPWWGSTTGPRTGQVPEQFQFQFQGEVPQLLVELDKFLGQLSTGSTRIRNASLRLHYSTKRCPLLLLPIPKIQLCFQTSSLCRPVQKIRLHRGSRLFPCVWHITSCNQKCVSFRTLRVHKLRGRGRPKKRSLSNKTTCRCSVRLSFTNKSLA